MEDGKGPHLKLIGGTDPAIDEGGECSEFPLELEPLTDDKAPELPATVENLSVTINTSVFIAGAEDPDLPDVTISPSTRKLDSDFGLMVQDLCKILSDPDTDDVQRRIAKGALSAIKPLIERQHNSDPEIKSTRTVTTEYVTSAVKLLEEIGIDVDDLRFFIAASQELPLSSEERQELFILFLKNFCKRQVDRRVEPDIPLDKLEIFLLFRSKPLISPAQIDEIDKLFADNDLNYQLLVRFILATGKIGNPSEKITEIYEQLIQGTRGQTESAEQKEGPVSSPYKYVDNTRLKRRKKDSDGGKS